MAKIFYSMCGEGRGHAARVRSITEALRHEHELVLLAPEQAFDFLAPRYPEGESSVSVRRIPGLRFHYSDGRLDLSRSITSGLGYLWHLEDLVADLTRQIEREQPDLVITDFEPALPRAAERCGVPYLSLDHQHFLTCYDLGSLPFALRQWARSMALAVRLHYHRQQATLVSSFFTAPLVAVENVHPLGPLLRREIVQAEPTDGDYFISYLRPTTPPEVVALLAGLDREVRVYGLGERPAAGKLTFHPFDDHRFVADLAGSAALIGAAGNQTIGEALHLGKPVFALPEIKHHEQRINAHFLGQMQAGGSVPLEEVHAKDLSGFIDRLPEYKRHVEQHYRGTLDGTPTALSIINGYLPHNAPPAKRATLEASPV